MAKLEIHVDPRIMATFVSSSDAGSAEAEVAVPRTTENTDAILANHGGAAISIKGHGDIG